MYENPKSFNIDLTCDAQLLPLYVLPLSASSFNIVLFVSVKMYHCYLRVSPSIVYVEWASRVNLVTIFGDLYQNKLWVICNNLNQFAHLSSASDLSNDVIKMAAIVLLMYTYKISYLKQ